MHLPISRPQDQRPRRMALSQEMRPGAAPKLSWLARRLFPWTAATGGGYSWELESRNNGRAYSPCARLFWPPWGIFIMNSFFLRDAAPTPNEAPVCEAASASMQRPHLPHLPRGAAMASGIVVRPLEPWSCFSCRRFCFTQCRVADQHHPQRLERSERPTVGDNASRPKQRSAIGRRIQQRFICSVHPSRASRLKRGLQCCSAVAWGEAVQAIRQFLDASIPSPPAARSTRGAE